MDNRTIGINLYHIFIKEVFIEVITLIGNQWTNIVSNFDQRNINKYYIRAHDFNSNIDAMRTLWPIFDLVTYFYNSYYFCRHNFSKKTILRNIHFESDLNTSPNKNNKTNSRSSFKNSNKNRFKDNNVLNIYIVLKSQPWIIVTVHGKSNLF